MRFIGLPKRKQRTTLLANRSSDATPLRIPSSSSASSRETKPLSHFKHACRHKRASSSSNRKQYDRKARSNDIPARMPRASASIISGRGAQAPARMPPFGDATTHVAPRFPKAKRQKHFLHASCGESHVDNRLPRKTNSRMQSRRTDQPRRLKSLPWHTPNQSTEQQPSSL